MRRRVAYIRLHGATVNTPISSFKKGNKWQQIRGDNITTTIIANVRSAGPSNGFTKADISAHSLCLGGCMALHMAQVDPYTIRLVGRYRSDTIIHYLHMTAKSFTEVLSANMFEHGAYALIPPTHTSN